MFKFFQYLLAFISLITIYISKSSADESLWISSEENLRKALLNNYIQSVIPVENHTHPITVNIALVVNHIDIEDVHSKVTLYGALNLEWNDRKLQWDQNDFNGVNNIFLPTDKLWVPDLSLYNTVNGILLNLRHENSINLSSNGKINWSPHVKLETYCELNLKNWPFDKQTCVFVFGSWVHSNLALTPVLSENRPILHILSKNHNWKIIDTHSYIEEKVYACCPEPYPSITFSFDLVRSSPMLSIIVITPVIGIILMCLASFWLFPNRGEKILLNCFCLLLNAFCINYCLQKLPTYSEGIPMIVNIQILLFFLLTISTILSVLLFKITKNITGNLKVSPGLNRFLQNNRLSQIICLPYRNGSNVQKEQTELKDHFEDGKSADNNLLIKKSLNSEDIEDEGIILAIFIDRIFFFIYLLIFLTLILICTI